MKRVICTITICVAINLTAQTPSNPLGLNTANTGTTTVNTGVAGANVSVNTAVPMAVPGLALTNAFYGVGLMNQAGGAFSMSDLSSALATLQNDVQQILPMLSAFNGNFMYVPNAAFQATPGTNASLSANLSQNLSQNMAGNLSANLAQNVAQNVATPTGNAAPPTQPAVFAVGASTAPPPGTMAPAPPGTTSSSSYGSLFAGQFSSNAVAAFNASRDTVRMLMMLQSDLERMLPEVAALNGGAVSLPAAGYLGGGYPAGLYPGGVYPRGVSPGAVNPAAVSPTGVPSSPPSTPANPLAAPALAPTGR